MIPLNTQERLRTLKDLNDCSATLTLHMQSTTKSTCLEYVNEKV